MKVTITMDDEARAQLERLLADVDAADDAFDAVVERLQRGREDAYTRRVADDDPEREAARIRFMEAENALDTVVKELMPWLTMFWDGIGSSEGVRAILAAEKAP